MVSDLLLRAICRPSSALHVLIQVWPLQGDASAAEFAFVHVGRDLEEQQELLECLLAFFLQYLLADDGISSLLAGGAPFLACSP
jgi:hypothetical protein